MSRIFISYRREDTKGTAGRIFDRLAEKFGKGNLFMDVDHIEPGENFVKAIEDAVGSCDAVVAVMGEQWLGKDRNRLENPKDFVRLEIAAALKRKVRVIPVLVDGAEMPPSNDLPDDVRILTELNAVIIRHQEFNFGAGKLLDALANVLQEKDAEEKKRKAKGRRKAEAKRKAEAERKADGAEPTRREGQTKGEKPRLQPKPIPKPSPAKDEETETDALVRRVRTPFSIPSEEHRSHAYRLKLLRGAVGILGMLFPVFLATGCFMWGGCTELQNSISDYYHTGMHDWFVGILFAIGLFLFSYKGKKWNDNLGHLGCFFAVGVAVFPTGGSVEWIHLLCAAGLFLVLSAFSLFLFPENGQNARRNNIYIVCGLVMLLCMALIVVFYRFFPNSSIVQYKPVFWLESVLFWAFGISWLTKGEILRILWKDERAA